MFLRVPKGSVSWVVGCQEVVFLSVIGCKEVGFLRVQS